VYIMLTCIRVKTNRAFQHILTFYKRPTKQTPIIKVLDLTYAKGHSWEKTGEEKIDELVSHYYVVKADKNSYDNPDITIIDVRNSLPMFVNESFDVIYYDPPFYFTDGKKDIDYTKLLEKMLTTKDEVFWTINDFKISCKNLEIEVPRILKKGGIFIIKIGDAYTKDEYFPSSFYFWDTFKTSLKIMGHFMIMTEAKDCIFHMVKDNVYHYLVFKKE